MAAATACQLQPLGDRIVVRPFEADEVTPGGIVLPDTAKEKQQRGEVIAIGPGKLTDDGARSPMSVSVGDSVIFSAYGGHNIEVDGEDVRILSENDVLAIIAS